MVLPVIASEAKPSMLPLPRERRFGLASSADAADPRARYYRTGCAKSVRAPSRGGMDSLTLAMTKVLCAKVKGPSRAPMQSRDMSPAEKKAALAWISEMLDGQD